MNPNICCLVFAILMLPSLVFGQSDCGCLKNFDALVQKVSANYAGFTDKTNGVKQARYNRLHDSLRVLANRELPATDCFAILAAYTQYFNDRHLQLANYNKSVVSRQYEQLTDDQARQLTRNAQPTDLDGIWRSTDGKVQVAIIRQQQTGDHFKGIVLSSQDSTLQPGRVLFDATRKGQTYVMTNTPGFLSNHPIKSKKHGNIFYAYWGLTLTREYPLALTANEQDELAANTIFNGFRIREIEKGVALISIPHGFVLSDRTMDSLLKAHEPLLSRASNLIIDIRDNGGGNNTWEKMLPYFYDGPIEMKGSWFVRSSPDNIRMMEEDLQYFSGDQAVKEKAFIERLRQHPGQLLDNDGGTILIKLDTIRPNPQRVALLVNDICASSSEFLIQVAKKSKRVTVFGSNTSGTMDYGDLRRPVSLPCPDLSLITPMAKSPWTDTAPIDPTGIAPDVKLAHLPESQWLGEVVRQLKKASPISRKP